MTPPKLYKITPGAGSGATKPHYILGFRQAIAGARHIAEHQHCAVTVRNEADRHTWTVAFRVRGGRGPRGARCEVEVTR